MAHLKIPYESLDPLTIGSADDESKVYREELDLEVPDENLLAAIYPEEPAPVADATQACRDALAKPVHGPSFADLLKGAPSVAIVIDNQFRPTPTSKLLPAVLDLLEQAGVTDACVITGNGKVFPLSETDIEMKVGRENLDRMERMGIALHQNEPRNEAAYSYLGVTSRGTPVWVHSEVVKRDVKIAIGHAQANHWGYGGGGKLIMPGVASDETIESNHCNFTMSPQTHYGALAGPMRSDIDEIATMTGLDYTLNVLLDTRGRVIEIVGGAHPQAHRNAIEKFNSIYAYENPVAEHGQADIVVCGVFAPTDHLFFHTGWGCMSSDFVLRDGGSIIYCSPSPGVHTEVGDFPGLALMDLMKPYMPPTQDNYQRVLRDIHHRKIQMWAGCIWAPIYEVMTRKHLTLVTLEENLEMAGDIGIDATTSLEEAFAAAMERHGANAKVIVLPYARYQLPANAVRLDAEPLRFPQEARSSELETDRLTFSRRSLLKAGVLGAAALTGAAARAPAPALAAESGSASSAPGVYQFNQGWLFGGPYANGAETPGHSESGFTAVTLPHTVTPLSWGDWDATSWQQLWIYRKHLSAPANAGTRVFLDFQGVMTSATVFLGGVQIAQHQGGYLPFSVELTGGLAAGDNLLAVVVDARWSDVPPDGASGGAVTVDYLQPGGIYRDVALRIVPAVHISDVFAKPTNVLGGSPGVDVQVTIDAAAAPRAPVTISAAVLDGGTVIGSASGTVSVSSAGVAPVTLSITGLSGVTLWSPDTPKLYQVSASLVADGVTHSFAVNTGFRQATFTTGGFQLNGQRLEIFGLNRHQLFPYTGMAASARLQRRDAEILRQELNCNMVRCSHYPQSPDFLDACDELGLMVWEEPPGWQYVGDAAFQALMLQNVQDMVVRDRNRPSVVVWGTRLNESNNYPALYAQTRRLADSLDGTRQTSGAMRFYSTTDWAQDVFAYDDYHSSAGNATLQPPIAGVPYLVTEAVGALDGAPLYRWVDTEATLAVQAKMHAQVHSLAQANSAYGGLLAWAGIDYASLNGGNRIWHNLKWAGVLDTFRVAKPGAAFYRSQVDPGLAPVILPVFFWDFGTASPPNGPGAGTMLATNCDRLELYVGGQHFATGTPDTTDFAGLTHPPVIVDLTHAGTGLPELHIDGYRGATLVGSLDMSADPTRDRLALVVEDASIVGDGSDMTRFTFRAVDAYGNQRPYPTGDVTLTLAGPAALIAENPFSFQAYGGVGGGLIRSQPGTTGTVTVTATHATLGTASGTLTVTPQPPPAPGGSPQPPPAPVPAPPRTIARTTARPAGPSRARVRAALAGVLAPKGASARIARLLKRGGYTFRFDAPSTGKLVIQWNYEPPRKRHSKKPKPVRVAAATVSIKKAGRVSVKVKLTKRGRRLLEHAKREKLTARVSFTPIGRSTTSRTKVIELRR